MKYTKYATFNCQGLNNDNPDNPFPTEIQWERKQEENAKVKSFIQPLIDNQKENQRMQEAVKKINKMRPKQPLVIKSDEGLTSNGKTQTKIIAKYFKTCFGKMPSRCLIFDEQ